MHASTPRKSTLPPGYKEDPNATDMLRYEESLPRLPVPPLAQTCERYLESVQPHLTEAEFSTTTTAVKSFLSSPLAGELQKRLEARASQPEIVSWLSEWWNDVAYMAYRDPVVVFVSYYYVHLDDRTVRTQPKRAAQLIKAMLPFRALVDS
jgi:carnitine O-acetyltransferase